MSSVIRRRWSATHAIEGDRCEIRHKGNCRYVAEFNLATDDGVVTGVCRRHLPDALSIRVLAQKTPVLVSTRSYKLINIQLKTRYQL